MNSNGARMAQCIQFTVSILVVNWFELFKLRRNLNSRFTINIVYFNLYCTSSTAKLLK